MEEMSPESEPQSRTTRRLGACGHHFEIEISDMTKGYQYVFLLISKAPEFDLVVDDDYDDDGSDSYKTYSRQCFKITQNVRFQVPYMP